MQLSPFGESLSGHTGIMDLMDDMGRALAGSQKKYMLGGGNPARIPEIEQVWRERLTELLGEENGVQRLLGNYDAPQGQPGFIEAIAGLLHDQFGWPLTAENVGITNGSQSAFFLLFNMIPGRILFPLLPEYVGYADQAIEADRFVACRPLVERIDEHTHKYRIDFEAVELLLAENAGPGSGSRTGAGSGSAAGLAAASGVVTTPIGAICVSRPTNPSGNVLTDGEIRRLDELAQRYGIPLIIDNAYGMPFPHIVFEEEIDGTVEPIWNENIILGMSLSKIGLPGARTGIVIAQADVITALSRANAVASLANTMAGQVITEPLIRDGRILSLARSVIGPYYYRRMAEGRALLEGAFDPGVPWSLHRPEGSIFLWLWLPDLPVSSRELYERLKRRDLIVVPGEYFFFGDPSLDDWPHARQCLRLNYGQPAADVAAGFAILAEEVNGLWRG
jgi:valine--pyruvate aminotransferase